MVRAGEASVAYGNWPARPPGEPGPELEGLRRILDQYDVDETRPGALGLSSIARGLTKFRGPIGNLKVRMLSLTYPYRAGERDLPKKRR
jgi:hypothetical protein